jgi:hypothetical protein
MYVLYVLYVCIVLYAGVPEPGGRSHMLKY